MTNAKPIPDDDSTPSGWDAIEADDEAEHVAMVNGDHENLDGVFLAMIHANRIGDTREATRLARAYHAWLTRSGRTMTGYSVAEAIAIVRTILA